MNKTLIVILLFLSCKNEPREYNNFLKMRENDWKKDKLKGRVRSLEERSFRNDSLFLIEEFEYNNLGFRICKSRNVMNDKKEWGNIKELYIYDTVEGVIRYDEVAFGSPQGPVDSFYNKKGLLIRDTNYRWGSSNKYTYDVKNRLDEKVSFWSGQKYKLNTWSYFPNGSVKECVFDLEKNRKEEEITECDSVRTRKNFLRGSVINSEYCRKDTAGNVIYFSRDLNFNCLTSSVFTEYIYNNYNDVIMEVHHRSKWDKPDTTRYTYVYDKAGNWIKFNDSIIRTINYW